jgi:hypothetical protein
MAEAVSELGDGCDGLVELGLRGGGRHEVNIGAVHAAEGAVRAQSGWVTRL